MSHDIIIILSVIEDILKNLNGAQPETGVWTDLQNAVQTVQTTIENNPLNPNKRRHNKLHEVENLLIAGEPFDLNEVQTLTAALLALG